MNIKDLISKPKEEVVVITMDTTVTNLEFNVDKDNPHLLENKYPDIFESPEDWSNRMMSKESTVEYVNNQLTVVDPPYMRRLGCLNIRLKLYTKEVMMQLPKLFVHEVRWMMFQDKVQLICEGECFKLINDGEEAIMYDLVEVNGNYIIR